MKLSAAVLLSAVLGASAHPSSHGHGSVHRSLQARGEFVVAKKPMPTPAAPTPAAPTPYAPPKPTQSQGSGGVKIPFCQGSTSKRATEEEIAYKGNSGSAGQYGCNIMPISSDIKDLYDYTITFTNKESKPIVGVCWLKIGPKGLIDGFFRGNEALHITIPANQQQVLAVDTNTQGGCAFGYGSVPTTPMGQWAGTWLEFDFGNLSNGGWSGADASCLVPAAYGMAINSLSVCQAGKCSTVNQGGSGTNAYLAGMEAADGVGLNIPAGPAALDCAVGGF